MSTLPYLKELRTWAKSGIYKSSDCIDKSIVHKRDARNVFIARVDALSAGGRGEYLAQLAIDRDHPYYFEHPQDHVPGMMLIEAGRQLALAIAHLFYAVPLTTVFVVNNVTFSFRRFAELDAPIFVHCQVRDEEYRRNQLVAMSSGGDFVQHDEVLGSMSGRWTMYDRALIARLRRRMGRGDDGAAAAPLGADRSSRLG